ncbi:MAG: MFS transporter [Bacteroidetes bacterium]|nr:MFS transporter [Bacteroidota bacterium]
MPKQGTKNPFNMVVLVAALGYFVDIYDLQLFNVVSKDSLRGIGILDPVVIDRYDYLLFLWQMCGMLIGGLLWGILGDQKGRMSVLFGSILIYSLANVANAFVVDLTQYSIVRFIAGVGLAGELGAAITLVSEIMHRESRGYGTLIVVTMGALGAVAAAVISNNPFVIFGLQPWQMAYIIGGVLGLVLLLLRVSTYESGMFEHMKHNNQIKKGNFLMLFNDRARFKKYLACILVGLPVWFCIGILIKFSDKFAAIVEVVGEVKVGYAIMYAYLGLSVGDLISGLLSQLLKSRKKVVVAYLLFTIVLVFIFLFAKGLTANSYYFLCFMMGCATGYWALFVTIASEQFGTNIRATVTTTVPNFVRGAVVPIILGFKTLERSMGAVNSALVVGGVCISLAMIAIFSLKETFSKDLDYIEIS